MRISTVLTAVAGVLALAGVSHAGQIASPAIYGSFAQAHAECVVGNFSDNPVAVQVSILDESGNPVPSSTSCNAPIEAHFICQVTANIANGVAYACSVKSGSIAKVRAALTLSDSGFFPVKSAALR